MAYGLNHSIKWLNANSICILQIELAFKMNLYYRAICRSAGFPFLALTLLALCSHSAARDTPVKSLIEMRQSNVVIQKWDLSCGAATLTTLLNYQHGENLSEKEVALSLMNRPEYIDNPELIQIREGFSLLDLKRYVDGRGYKGLGFGKLKFDDLVNKAPVIVAINTHGYNHFVIFRGTRGNRVLLADPAWGNRTMLVDEFIDSWIEYPVLGRVGFVVERRDGTKEPSPLIDKGTEYVMLR